MGIRDSATILNSCSASSWSALFGTIRIKKKNNNITITINDIAGHAMQGHNCLNLIEFAKKTNDII